MAIWYGAQNALTAWRVTWGSELPIAAAVLLSALKMASLMLGWVHLTGQQPHNCLLKRHTFQITPSLPANLGLNKPKKGSLKFPNLPQCSPAIIKSATECVKAWGIDTNFAEAKPCGRWQWQPCHKICRICSEAVPLEQSRAVRETSL